MSPHRKEPRTDQTDSYHHLKIQFAHWASGRPDIGAIVIYGSQAREIHPADSYSDLDLIIFTSTPDLYRVDSQWLSSFGEIWLSSLERTEAGDPEWIVLLEGGIKVDIILARIETKASLHGVLQGSPYFHVFRRGMGLLYLSEAIDDDYVPEQQARADESAVSMSEYHRAVDRTLLTTVRATLILERGDLWRCQAILNGELRERLLSLVELHSKEVAKSGYDIWYGGRYIDLWTDPEIYRSLEKTFAIMDEGSIRNALSTVLRLTTRLAAETSDASGYGFPTLGQQKTINWLHDTFIG